VGLYKEGQLVGVAIWTGLSVPETAKGAFGLDRNDQAGIFELSRLVLEPSVQEKEHNLAGWFLSRAEKYLKKSEPVRALITYADDDHHCGVVYAATNWTYHGLTEPKKDFWFANEDGTFTKHSRGKVAGAKGEWRPRSRKHRFTKVFDDKMQTFWPIQKWENSKNPPNMPQNL